MFNSSTFGKYTKKWLIGMGLFELALAVVFVVGAFVVPFVGGAFFITAAILGLTGVICIAVGQRVGRSAERADRILTQGIAGSASITGLRQTGMYLNEQPQVEMDLLVQLPDRPPYPAKRKEFVPLILLARLSSGAPLSVRVDPADPASVIIDWQAPAAFPMAGAMPMASMAPAPGAMPMTPTAAAPGAPLAPGAALDETLGQVQAALAASGMPAAAPFQSTDQAGYTIEQLRAQLRATGVPGFARIDKLADTGQVVGDERLFTMQVTLELPGQPPRQLDPSAAMVPLVVAGKVQLGMRVPVKVAADNPGLLMFEWEKL